MSNIRCGFCLYIDKPVVKLISHKGAKNGLPGLYGLAREGGDYKSLILVLKILEIFF